VLLPLVTPQLVIVTASRTAQKIISREDLSDD
jgi:hypothetical protein